DGLDEVSLSAPTSVEELRDGYLHAYSLAPEDLGLKRAPLEELKGGSPAENAARIRSIFGGTPGPGRDFVLLNAACALVAASAAHDFAEGVRIAAQSIDSGAAMRALDAFVAATQAEAGA
ncbi:MAG TPA: anthranilate phosphoribosyltransferase, partial [Dehalococcoidia bacterium]|nr:anthranilate phosphoribosyltransferase [Dehalococcoidia bacterium]